MPGSLNQIDKNAVSFGFKLIYSNSHVYGDNYGTSSVFYTHRNLTDDFNKIFDLIRYDGLFFGHDCFLKIDLKNYKCEIFINGWDMAPSQSRKTFEFISQAIESKLLLAGLYDHFYICSNTTSPDYMTKTIFDISYDPVKISLPHKVSKNQMEIEKLKFPEDDVPDAYCCVLTSELIDIPYRDRRQDGTIYEFRNFLKHTRKHHKNPITNLPTHNDKQYYDFYIWDKIQTFLDKVRYLYARQIPYSDYKKEVLNEKLSVFDLADVVDDSSKTEIQFDSHWAFKEAKNYLGKKRFTNAVYYFKHVLGLTKSGEEINFIAKLYCAILYNKLGEYGISLEFFEEVGKQKPNNYISVLYGILLSNVANYYLSQDKFDLALKLINLADKNFKSSSEFDPFFDRKEEILLYYQVSILAETKCVNSFAGHCKAVRRIAATGSEFQLSKATQLLDWFPHIADTSPKGGYTALHQAIMNDKFENAWLITIHGSSCAIKSAVWRDEKNILQGGVTAEDLILKHKNPRYKMLLCSNTRFAIELGTGITEAALMKNMPTYLARLKEILGLGDSVDLIYLHSEKTIIFANFYLKDQSTQDAYINFIIKSIEKDASIKDKIKIKNLQSLVDQKALYKFEKLSFDIKLNCKSLNNSNPAPDLFSPFNPIKGIFNNQEIVQHACGYIQSCFVGVIKTLGLGVRGSFTTNINYSEHTFTIAVDCESAECLYEFFRFYLNNCFSQKLFTNGVVFECSGVKRVGQPTNDNNNNNELKK